jgi:hypothetical protein
MIRVDRRLSSSNLRSSHESYIPFQQRFIFMGGRLKSAKAQGKPEGGWGGEVPHRDGFRPLRWRGKEGVTPSLEGVTPSARAPLSQSRTATRALTRVFLCGKAPKARARGPKSRPPSALLLCET